MHVLNELVEPAQTTVHLVAQPVGKTTVSQFLCQEQSKNTSDFHCRKETAKTIVLAVLFDQVVAHQIRHHQG
jgi:hypothetical protein